MFMMTTFDQSKSSDSDSSVIEEGHNGTGMAQVRDTFFVLEKTFACSMRWFFDPLVKLYKLVLTGHLELITACNRHSVDICIL